MAMKTLKTYDNAPALPGNSIERLELGLRLAGKDCLHYMRGRVVFQALLIPPELGVSKKWDCCSRM